MIPNRRAEAQARALIGQSEAMVARAAARLIYGDPLSAMRTLRTAQQLYELDTRLRVKRHMESEQRKQLEARRLELAARAAELDHREHVLKGEEQRLRREREKLMEREAAVEQLYMLMYHGRPAEDGPAPATDGEAESGVAP